MKRFGDAALCLFLPAVLFLSGCLDEEVRTKISADGSSERAISLKLATKKLPEGAFPVPGDSTWAVEWKEIKEKDAKFEYVARKKFQTPDELHREYAALPDTAPIGLTVSVKKRFEWFFTYIDYDEVYIYRNPFRSVPVTDFLTREEIERFQRGDRSELLKEKFKRWEDRNLFEEVYGALVAEAERRNDPALSASLLAAKKEDW